MKKILIVLVTLLVILLAIGFLVPSDYTLSRSVVIAAPPEVVHRHVGDLEQWPKWTPWQDQDPSLAITYGERTTGVGAHQSWSGERGGGELTFTASDPATGIAYDMAFVSGDTRIPASSTMTYRPVDGGTEVTWAMQGSWKGAVPAVAAGWMKLLTPWMLGGQFDTGLTRLKTLAEAG